MYRLKSSTKSNEILSLFLNIFRDFSLPGNWKKNANVGTTDANWYNKFLKNLDFTRYVHQSAQNFKPNRLMYKVIDFIALVKHFVSKNISVSFGSSLMGSNKIAITCSRF
jgi:hypothetical protein